MNYDQKQTLRAVALGAVGGVLILGGGFLAGRYFSKDKSDKCREQPTTQIQYNINGDNNTIINSDVRVNTKIKARDITIAPTYNSNQSQANTSSNGTNTTKPASNTGKTQSESIDERVEDNRTNTNQVTNTSNQRQDNAPSARFKGYDDRGMPYWQVIGSTERFTISPRQYRSIVVRNNGFWYGSYRLSTMPSDMERSLENQFRSRPSTTRGNYFHSGWNYGNNNDRHW